MVAEFCKCIFVFPVFLAHKCANKSESLNAIETWGKIKSNAPASLGQWVACLYSAANMKEDFIMPGESVHLIPYYLRWFNAPLLFIISKLPCFPFLRHPPEILVGAFLQEELLINRLYKTLLKAGIKEA